MVAHGRGRRLRVWQFSLLRARNDQILKNSAKGVPVSGEFSEEEGS